MLDNTQIDKVEDVVERLQAIVATAPDIIQGVMREATAYATPRVLRSIGKRVSKSNESAARVFFKAADEADEIIKGDQLCMTLGK